MCSPFNGPSIGRLRGVFAAGPQVAGHTVLEPLAQGEPVLETRLASADKGSGSAGVPTGMRAVSVHVSDSSGVLAKLAPGQKVDVQVLVTRKTTGAEPQLRTILEGIQVLSVNPQLEQTSQGSNLPAVTLLTNAADGRCPGAGRFGRTRTSGVAQSSG